MPVDPEKLRSELGEIGERRRHLTAEIERLAKDTAQAVKKARGCKEVSMTEVASLVALDRTYLYRGYR